MNDEVLEQLRKLWDDNGEVEDVNPKSTHKKYWSCSRCHQQYQATVHTMIVTYKKTGWACPSCSGRIVVKGYNDLATTDPDIAKWLDPSVDGSSIPCGKRTDLPFTCENGHHYRATIRQMRKGVHCPVCKAGGVVADHEDLMLDWDPDNEVDPSTTTCGSPRIVKWICHDCGNRWTSSIYNRTHRGAGCPECVKKRMSTTTRLRYAKAKPFSDCPESRFWDDEKNTISLSMQSAGSPDMRWFTCENGHSFQQEVRDVVKRGIICKHCQKELIDDPVSSHADLMSYWNDKHDPTATSTDMTVKLEWLCPVCGSNFKSRPKTLVNLLARGRKACPVCDYRTLVPGVNDLATTRPDLAAELIDPAKAKTVTERSDDKLEWKCMTNPDHPPYTTTPRQRVNGVNCKTCTALRRAAENNRTRLRKGQSDPIPDWIMDYAIPEDRKRMVDRGMSAGSSETVTIIYPDCGHERSTTICNMGRSPKCPICAYGMHMSKGQDELTEWLRSVLGHDAVQSNKSGLLDGRKELDIYIPSMKTAIEYNGLYWHNEDNVGKSATYDKWKACKDKGIRLLTIWDDDWNYRKDLVKRTVKSILLGPTGNHDSFKSYVHPSEALARAFMDRNHLGRYKDAPYRIAVVGWDHRFLAMMIGSMDDHTGTFTISAYADVYGDGWFLATLLDKARTDVKPQKMRADLDHCLYDGAELNRFGFIDYAEKEPEFFLTDGNHMVRHYDSDSMDGFYRVYDAGRTTMVLPNADK